MSRKATDCVLVSWNREFQLIPAATTTNPITPARVIGTWAKAAAPDWTGPVVLADPPAVVVVEEELVAPPVVVAGEDEVSDPPVEVVEEDELEILLVVVEATSVAVVLLDSVTKVEELVELIVAVVKDVLPVSEVELILIGTEEDDLWRKGFLNKW